MSNRSEEEISLILSKSLQLVLSGKMTVDAVLLRYPDLVDVLRPELETAVWLSRKSAQFRPRTGFVAQSKRRLMSRIEKEAALQHSRPAARATEKAPALNWQSWMVRFAAVAIVFVVLFMSFTGTVYAAKDTVPGDGLYGFKRWTEETTYSMTSDPQRRIELNLAYSSRRVEEAAKLLARGQTDRVAQVLNDYESEVGQAMAILETFEKNGGRVNERLAAFMDTELTRQTEKLTVMMSQVPSEKKDTINHALETSKKGSEQVEDSVGQGNGPKGTPTDSSQNQGQPGNNQGKDATTQPGKGPEVRDTQGVSPTQEVKPTREEKATKEPKAEVTPEPPKDKGSEATTVPDDGNQGKGNDNGNSGNSPPGQDKDKDKNK